MATVTIPLLLSDVTGATREATVPGETIGELIDALDARFPGFRGQIQRGGKVVSTLTFTVDGKIATRGLETPVPPEARVAILPTFGGG
jgi:sulfur-carrier protein